MRHAERAGPDLDPFMRSERYGEPYRRPGVARCCYSTRERCARSLLRPSLQLGLIASQQLPPATLAAARPQLLIEPVVVEHPANVARASAPSAKFRLNVIFSTFSLDVEVRLRGGP